MLLTIALWASFLTLQSGDSNIHIDSVEMGTHLVFPELSRSCGLNSLHTMILLNDKRVSEDRLRKVVKRSEKGTSLKELKSAADALGYDYEVYRCKQSELSAWHHYGVIALIHQAGGDFLTDRVATGHSEMGHYVTLCGMRDGKILAFDGTFGHMRTFSVRRFEEVWTGVVLAPKLVEFRNTFLFALGFTITSCAAFVVIAKSSVRRFSVLLFLFSHASVLAQEPARSPTHDATNSVYIVQRILDQQHSYAEVAKMIPPASSSSVSDVRDALRECGIPVEALKCPPKDLPVPAILYMESEDEFGGGYFVLATRDQGGGTVLVDSGLMSFLRIDEDEFLRTWSGVAIALPPAVRHGNSVLIASSIAIILAILFVLLRRRQATGRSVGTAVVGLLVSAMLAQSSFGAELEPAIREALTENCRGMEQVEISYSIVCTSELEKSVALARIERPGKVELFDEKTRTMILQGDKWLMKYETPITVDGEYRISVSQNSFNGEVAFTTNTGKVVTIMDRDYLQSRTSLKNLFGYNYFLNNVGFVVADRNKSKWYGLESKVLFLLNKGATLESSKRLSENEHQIILRTPDTMHRFFLDPSQNYSLTRHEECGVDGKPKYVVTNSKFSKLSTRKTWLPRESSMDCYTWPSIPKRRFDAPVIVEKLSVSAISTKRLPETIFSLDWKKPGALIGDSRVEGAEGTESGFVNYRVPADLNQIDEAIARARENGEFQPRRGSSVSHLVIWAATITGVLFLLAFGLWIQNSRKKI